MTGMLVDVPSAVVLVVFGLWYMYPVMSTEWVAGIPSLMLTMLSCMVVAGLCEDFFETKGSLVVHYIDYSLPAIFLSIATPVCVLAVSAVLADRRSTVYSIN